MKTVIEDISAVRKKIAVEIAPEAVALEIDKAIAEMAKKAKVPGFRLGKVPREIVARRFKDEIMSEVTQRIVSESYLTALQEHKLNPVDAPEIGDVSTPARGSSLSFTAVVEVRPRIDLGVYDGIEIKEAPVAVSDEEVGQAIEQLREMAAQLEVVEGRPLEKSDTAIVDFEGFMDDKPIPNAKAADHVLPLGSDSLIPGFEEQLVGMNLGETRKIKVTFPADYSNKELAGKGADFTVVLKEIKKKVLPELNDEFAKDMGNNASVEELRTQIKKDLEYRKKNELAASQREELLAKLTAAHSFELPPGMVDRELRSMARAYATRLVRRGVDVASFNFAEFSAENKPLAEKRVKGTLLLDVIAEKEDIATADQEVNSAVATMARSSGQTEDSIRKYYEEHEGGLEELRFSLTREKTLSLLHSRAKKSYNQTSPK
jgi:trigger factor